MQPYFLPYIGYFQLIAAVDLFVVYDNIKYTKKGWINRNRMLKDGAEDGFLHSAARKDADSLDMRDREVSVDFDRGQAPQPVRRRLSARTRFRAIVPAAGAASCGTTIGTCSPSCITPSCGSASTSGSTTVIEASSAIAIDHALKSQDKVLASVQGARRANLCQRHRRHGALLEGSLSRQGVELEFLKSGALRVSTVR